MDQKVLADLGGTERWDRHLEARKIRAGFLEEVGLLAGLGGGEEGRSGAPTVHGQRHED